MLIILSQHPGEQRGLQTQPLVKLGGKPGKAALVTYFFDKKILMNVYNWILKLSFKTNNKKKNKKLQKMSAKIVLGFVLILPEKIWNCPHHLL